MNPEAQINTSLPVEETSTLRRLARSFSPGARLLFFIVGIICIISGVYSLIQLNNKFLVEVPAKGGVLSEGMIGSPRFINPLLALSDTDKSLVTLVYSGLLKPDMNGGYKSDLAESIAVSDDGLIYDVKIKDNAAFHDGRPVSADDVLFTINKALDPIIKSPKRANWEGVAVEKVSDKEIRFTLKKAYFPFLDNLTLGILPKHIWQSVTPEEFAFSTYNVKPIGSGPYKVNSVKKNDSGLPTEISLKPFKKYVFEDPFISEIKLSFFQNENSAIDSLQNGSISALGGVSPSNEARARESSARDPFLSPLPRVFGAFFNQNQAPVFANKEVRVALDTAVDKAALTQEILKGFGVPLAGPTPDDVWTKPDTASSSLEEARAILARNGWKANADGILEKKVKTGTQQLAFSISTSDVPDLKRTAEILKDSWTQLGASVDIKVFEASDLTQNVIKPRKYDVLLFGEVVGRELDLYPFWHSSERNDPGLNIALYTNITADKLLDDIRSARTREERDQKLALFKKEIKTDVPAVFLYAPHYIYVVGNDVKNVTYPQLGSAADRFSNISEWYIDTARVWNIFAKKE